MSLTQRFHHGEDEGISNDFEMCGCALRLVRVIDFCAAHDAFAEGEDAVHLGFWSGEHADELAVVGHCWGAEDWAGDEVGSGGVDGLSEFVGGVGVDCATVDEEFALGCFWGGREGGVDGFFDGGIVGETGEDDVG